MLCYTMTMTIIMIIMYTGHIVRRESERENCQ